MKYLDKFYLTLSLVLVFGNTTCLSQNTFLKKTILQAISQDTNFKNMFIHGSQNSSDSLFILDTAQSYKKNSIIGISSGKYIILSTSKSYIRTLKKYVTLNILKKNKIYRLEYKDRYLIFLIFFKQKRVIVKVIGLGIG
jgi:hypothetical protein